MAKSINYSLSALGILLAVAESLCGEVAEFKIQEGSTVSDDSMEKLIATEKKNARNEKRDRQISSVPYIWNAISNQPGLSEAILAYYWDLNDSAKLLYLQQCMLNPVGVEAQLLYSKAVAIGAYLAAVNSDNLPDGHPLKKVDVEEEVKAAVAETEKKYKAILEKSSDKKSSGKDALKNMGKELDDKSKSGKKS